MNYALTGKLTHPESEIYGEVVRVILALEAWWISSGEKFDSVSNIVYNTLTNPEYAKEIKEKYEYGLRNFLSIQYKEIYT